MTNWKNTGLLVAGALALAGFILLYERRVSPTNAPPPPPPRLLPQLSVPAVTTLQLRRTNQFVLRAERSGEGWRLTAPVPYPAAPQGIEALLAALEQARLQTQMPLAELAARKQSLADFGLDAPQAIVVIEQGSEKQEIQFGSMAATADQVYAKVVGIPAVLLVSAELLAHLPRTANDWRDASLFGFGGGMFDRVDIARGQSGHVLQFDRTNQTWRLIRPPHRADQVKVNSLVAQLQQARVLAFVSDQAKADLDLYGLQAPELDVTLGFGTNPVQRVQFGKSPTNDPSRVYVRRFSHTNIVLAPKSVLEMLSVPAAELRDRQLLAVSAAAVDMIEVRSAEPFVLRRQTNDLWMTSDGVAADPWYMRDWLDELAKLQVAEFVKDVVTDFSDYGLAPPDRQYLFKTTATNSVGITNLLLAQLEFSTNLADRVFVRRTDEDSVYAIHAADYYRMPAASWHMRDRRVWAFATNQVARVTIRQGQQTRQLLRPPSGEWTLPAGAPGLINPWAVEETLFRLGELRAEMWVARGETNRAAYGLTPPRYQLAIELKEPETRTLTLEFGGRSPARLPYAATTLDGQLWIFEFPWRRYLEVQRDLSISPRTD